MDKRKSLLNSDANTKMTFGKYNGEFVGDIINHNKDYSYLLWAHRTVEWFSLIDCLYDDILKARDIEWDSHSDCLAYRKI